MSYTIEHLPWDDIDKALQELSRVTKKYVIISIPYSTTSFELVLRFPLIEKIFKKSFIDLCLRIPHFFRNIKFSGEHYWEMGRRHYPARKVRKLFKKRFRIVKEIRLVLDSYHHFFVLEKI